jgi:hypothetical protein
VNAYPGSFPCPSRADAHAVAMEPGLVRSPTEQGDPRERRAWETLPQRVALTFVINQEQLASWLAWMNAHAWDEWISMRLPGLKASKANTPTTTTTTTPTAVRFCADLAAELLEADRLWWWRVHVSAEYVPLPGDFPPLPGDWIVGGTPLVPALAWVLPGTPAKPARTFINPGTPAAPTAAVGVDEDEVKVLDLEEVPA